MGAALALGSRGRGRTAPNPPVGCVIVANGCVAGRGWTQPGGRPHAEAMALRQAGAQSRGATCYTTLEPCAHRSERGPTCSDLLIEAGIARVVAALGDPDPRTDGDGFARLRAAGIVVTVGVRADEARASLAGFLTRRALGRPYVTLKLATSLDGCIATGSGESRWITGPASRAHAHLERSRHEAILVGRGTWEADAPALDVRLAGLEHWSPRRFVLTSAPLSRYQLDDWNRAERVRNGASEAELTALWLGDTSFGSVTSPHAIADLPGIDHLLIEGGARTAAAFLAADLVDRLLLYRAPIMVGGGLAAIAEIGLSDLAAAHGRWLPTDARALGSDRVEVYERRRS